MPQPCEHLRKDRILCVAAEVFGKRPSTPIPHAGDGDSDDMGDNDELEP